MLLELQTDILTAHNHVIARALKDKIRYYLHGVHIETVTGGLRLTSTDSKILLCTYAEVDSASIDQYHNVILDGAELKRAMTGYKSDTVEVELVTSDQPHAIINGCKVSYIDGTFPDYSRVVPTGKPSGEVAHYDPDLVQVFAKVAKQLTGYKLVEIQHNGNDPARVPISDSAFGVIMPFRAAKDLPHANAFNHIMAQQWAEPSATQHAAE